MMVLTIWTPTGLVLSHPVKKVVANGLHGSFCILPKHIDAVAGLRPGILLFDDGFEEGLLAIHEGCLTKKGEEVTVVTLQAYRGDSLEQLAKEVEDMLQTADEGERRTRAALAGLESRITRGLAGLESTRVRI